MFPRSLCPRGTLAGLFMHVFVAGLVYIGATTPAHASDTVFAGGGTMAQIVDGGGTRTTLTLINLDSSAAPYTLYFYDDNGNPFALSTTAGGSSSILAGTLNPNASIIIQTNGAGATISQGWAQLITNNTIAGSAVFGIPVNGQFLQASCPLDTGEDDRFGLPFDHTTSVTGVAIANSWIQTPLTVTVTIFDINGNQILTDSFSVPGSGHTAFMLTDRYPQLAGVRGFALFSGSYFMNVLGLRATATTFTSITPIVAVGW
jgi:hypothetical protein